MRAVIYSIEGQPAAPKLLDFDCIIAKPAGPEYFFDREDYPYSFSMRGYDGHEAVGCYLNLYTSCLNFRMVFHWDTLELPKIDMSGKLTRQYISYGSGTPKTNDYIEAYRFIRETKTNAECVMDGLPLADYLKSYTHLPNVVDFLKLYEATQKSASRNTEWLANTLDDEYENLVVEENTGTCTIS